MQHPLTILIPCYKEGKRLGSTLDTLANYLNENKLAESTDVLIFDGGSPDDTREVALAHASLFPNFRLEGAPAHLGKGRDVQHGMLHATSDRVLFMDADLATPLRHIPEMIRKADEGFDIVIGVRDTQKFHKGLIRRIISWGGNLAVQILILPGIGDTQCGFKLFTQEALRNVFPRQINMGWTFDMEILAIARKIFKYKIAAVPIHDWRDVAGGTFSASSSIAIKSLVDLLKIRINLWLGKYK